MTEYDYSPDAVDRYRRKQDSISKWVKKTNQQGPLRDPHTPATPAPVEHSLDDYDDIRIHHRGQSYDQYDRPRERGFDTHGDKSYDRDKKPRSLHHSTRPRRHRSSSQSAIPAPRSYVPPPLPLPPQPWHMSYSQKPSPTAAFPTVHPQYYPPTLTSPRDSRHSSHSSSTRIHSPNSYFPPQSSPVNYSHSPDTSHGYSPPVPLRNGRVPDFTVCFSQSKSKSKSKSSSSLPSTERPTVSTFCVPSQATAYPLQASSQESYWWQQTRIAASPTA